ncbi:hypothetical protein EPIR_2449 [Erwinia piriflorinigrans CFBP 5888]|uniref:Uncharacterized protein n=1 Tax=Erwinia piriflorinigrans CFBP 5888 TaxID=1161919 RepID=V5Z8W8_9GAMM|nr:hypothetical protein EPIR_2449 [Erwinia piriflorinigrans CFBP 5888]
MSGRYTFHLSGGWLVSLIRNRLIAAILHPEICQHIPIRSTGFIPVTGSYDIKPDE